MLLDSFHSDPLLPFGKDTATIVVSAYCRNSPIRDAAPQSTSSRHGAQRSL
jgi:hypothetical protein